LWVNVLTQVAVWFAAVRGTTFRGDLCLALRSRNATDDRLNILGFLVGRTLSP
jgi:hypothetical protein